MSLMEVEVPRTSANGPPPERKDTPSTREVRHEYTHSLPPLLNQLGVCLLVSTYQAGKVVAVGVAQGELMLSYHNFERAMGLAVKADAIAVGARAQVWFLRSAPDIGRTEGKRKLPVHFRLKDGSPFAFAGIWGEWKGSAGSVFTCAILTTTPNELTGMVHDRMPVILARGDEASWLDPALDDAAKLLPMLRSYPAAEMTAVPANPAMNKPSFEGPESLATPA